MTISSFSIRNPVVTTAVILALVGFGLLALVSLDRDEFPEVNPPLIVVSVPYPGAAPRVVEREVVDRMEESFSSISGIKQMRSTAMDGFALLRIEFQFEKNLQDASQDIRDSISKIRQDLPPEMEEPVITRFDPQDLPIVSLTLVSPQRSAAELTRLADPRLTRALRSVPGVAEVRMVGGATRELNVELKPAAMQAAGVAIGEVVDALRSQNLAVPVGRVTHGFAERTIRLRGRLEQPSQFAAMVVKDAGGRMVRLGDVATIRDGTEEPRSLALFNGEPAVGLDVIKMTGASTPAVSSAIRNRMAELQGSLPEDVSLRIVRDSGPRVEESVSDVETSLLEGALLTVLVVFLFLASWRSTVITGLALPVSVLAAFIPVWLFGFTLNTLSLLGLSLAIGILIDDAIVVRENIVRHMEMGKDHLTAAREGTAEIGLAVMATTFSIVVVFVPIAFMGGVAQQWFAPLALTIAAAVLVSLFVSFTLDPMMSAHWSDPEVESGRKTWLTRPLNRWNRWFDAQTERYRRMIGWALDHRVTMLLLATVTFVGALAMPPLGIIGSAFFPEQDRSEFIIGIETPPGSTLEYTRRKALAASDLARSVPEVAYTYSTVGSQGDVVDEAQVYVRLVPRKERRRPQHEIAYQLRDSVKRLAGATASVVTNEWENVKQIQVQISGPDIDELNRLAERIRTEVKQVPGAVDVGLSTRGQRPELEVAVDRSLAATMGLNVQQIAQALRFAFAGIDVGDWVDPQGETRDVVARLSPEARARTADLASLPIAVRATGPAGVADMIPLGQVATIQPALGPAQIAHLDQRRVVTVGANTQGRPLSAVVSGIEDRLSRIAAPPGYEVSQGGETEDQREVFARIFTALAAAIMLMYVILVIQFRSFLDPIPIMASLPLSLIGVMLALLLTGSTLNLMSMIGVILLMGIVAKNAILLIDFAKWRQATGISRRQAIIEAGGVRLRPILMTSMAIIAGMMPIAIGGGEGGDFRAPLGRAVIGGVITSTVLTLLVIPTAYDMLAGWRERAFIALRTRRRHRRSAGDANAPAEA